MVFFMLVEGTGDNGNEPFFQALLPIFGASGIDCRGKTGYRVGLPVPGGKMLEIRTERIVLGTKIGMYHRPQVGKVAEHTFLLQGTPDGVLPIIGNRTVRLMLVEFAIFDLTAHNIAAQAVTQSQKLLYLGHTAAPSSGPFLVGSMLVGMRIGTPDSQPALFD